MSDIETQLETCLSMALDVLNKRESNQWRNLSESTPVVANKHSDDLRMDSEDQELFEFMELERGIFQDEVKMATEQPAQRRRSAQPQLSKTIQKRETKPPKVKEKPRNEYDKMLAEAN